MMECNAEYLGGNVEAGAASTARPRTTLLEWARDGPNTQAGKITR